MALAAVGKLWPLSFTGEFAPACGSILSPMLRSQASSATRLPRAANLSERQGRRRRHSEDSGGDVVVAPVRRAWGIGALQSRAHSGDLRRSDSGVRRRRFSDPSRLIGNRVLSVLAAPFWEISKRYAGQRNGRPCANFVPRHCFLSVSCLSATLKNQQLVVLDGGAEVRIPLSPVTPDPTLQQLTAKVSVIWVLRYPDRP